MAPDELWREKYAARFAESRAKEESRREQAFLTLPTSVCGEEIRPMTARDLLILNGIESPFVCPGEVEPVHLATFLWVLHAENDGTQGWRNLRRRDAMFRRLGPQNFDACVAGVREYVDGIFQDAPKGSAEPGERRPLGTCFLVPLVMRIAKETGWDRNAILDTPLAELFQYLKYIAAREQGKDFNDWSPSDAITNEFLCELNTR